MVRTQLFSTLVLIGGETRIDFSFVTDGVIPEVNRTDGPAIVRVNFLTYRPDAGSETDADPA